MGLLPRLLVFLLLFLPLFTLLSAGASEGAAAKPGDGYDVVVAGASMGGVAAAIQAARMGASVLVVEPGGCIGGQAVAAGVSTMDDLSRIRSGIYLEFISRVQGHYEARGKSTGTCYWDARSIAFEPHVGQAALYDLVGEARRAKGRVLDIALGAEVCRVKREGNRVCGVAIRKAGREHEVPCRVLIDASEYGDVLAMAGAPYRAGNSVAPFIDPGSMIQDITWVAILRKYPGGVPAKLRPRSPLPGYELARRNYESFVTPDGANFRGVYPVELPLNFISHNAYRGLPDSSTPWDYNADRENWPYITKSGVNWGNDYPGKYGWEGKRGLPAAYLEDPAMRGRIEREALIKTLHFIYYVQNELGEDWSVADDEYDHQTLPEAARGLPEEWKEIARRMPPAPYVRESRRAVGEHTLTSKEILKNSLSYRDGQTSHEFPDAIAIGGYILDLHGADTDADMEPELGERASSARHDRPRGPFQVPMRILIPKGIEGLLAAEKNLSMSRLSAGALRLQPICMMTGQAAGALAALASREGTRLRDMPAVRVQRALLDAGVVLSLCKYSDVPPGHPFYKAAQISSLYGLIAPLDYPHSPSYNISDLDDPRLAMALIRGEDEGRFGVDEMITAREALSMIGKARAASGTDAGNLPSLGEKPDSFVSRGVFARALCEAFGFLQSGAPGGKARGKAAAAAASPFKASNHRHAPAVAALGPLGVLDAYRGDREFRFGRPVTRGEAADMLMRAMTAAPLPQAR